MKYEKYFPNEFAAWLDKYAKKATDITLIRDKNMFISENGKLIISELLVSAYLLNNIVEKMCNGSVYASQHMLKKGYIKLSDGTRIGVTGKIVSDENSVATHMRDISAINIRVPREIIGAAKDIIPYIAENDNIFNTLIIGPPSSGKTTILRDIISFCGNRFRTGIADERGELSERFNLGNFTFSMQGGSKEEMMIMLLRSMSPDVIFTDEVGTKEDENAIKKLINAGVKIICTAHGYNVEDLLRRTVLKELILNKVFERLVIISKRNGVGTLEKIINTEDIA